MAFRSRLRIFSAFAIAIGLAAVAPATAQPRLADGPIAVRIARAAPGMSAAALFRTTSAFHSEPRQTALGGGDFWVLSEPFRLHDVHDIRFSSVWLRRITLYARYADGAIWRETLDGRGISHHLQLGAIIQQRPPVRPAALVRLLWHVEGSANLRGILIGAQVATPDESARANLLMGTLYAGFAGLSIALLVYNLALWGALRHGFQLAYCAMIVALLAYAFSSSGAMAWAWPDLANTDRLRINYLTLTASAVAALAFARTFFEPSVFAGAIGRMTTSVGILLLGGGLAFGLFAPWQIAWLDRLHTSGFLALILVAGPVLWRAWRVRSTFLWLFALAWGTPLAMAVVRLANAFGLMRYRFWIDNSTIFSMAAEALLSSLAIAYRMRLLSVERDEARANATAARLLADTDSLTGLLNRRAFLARAIGRDGEQTLLIADLDHFKQVNDTIGHDGGDEVLRVVARTLRRSVSADALVARIGGEEFAILAPAHHAIVADDILAGLRAGRMPFDIAVTASIGTCTGPLLCEADWKALYTCADRALFEAKSAGRDRVRERILSDRLAA